MSNRCTCCHICHTSLKTSRRSFINCTSCPSIICRQCVELTDQDWETVCSLQNWSCPRCEKNCPCKRCVIKANNNSQKIYSNKRKSNKRKRSPATIFEDNAFPTKVQKNSIEQQVSDHFEKHNLRSTKSKKNRIVDENAYNQKKNSDSSPVTFENKQNRVIELCNKNQQCLDYICRTERLLNLIRSEQIKIQEELISLSTKNDDKDVNTNIFGEKEEEDEKQSNDSDSDDSVSSSLSDDENPDIDFKQTIDKEKEISSFLDMVIQPAITV